MSISLDHHIARRAATIHDLWAVLRIPPRRPHRNDLNSAWRLIQPPEHGFFHGLEASTTSIALATDGVHMLCEKFDSNLVEGHITNWVKVSSIKAPHVMKKKAKRKDKQSSERSEAAIQKALATAELVNLLTE